ncbi:hypothetical protein SBADM41S_00673 [Streptomyces badius]
MVNSAIRSSSILLRGTREPRPVRSGAPRTTPIAYADTRYPAVGTDVPRSSATLGSRPIMTNSVVPMPKALTARARRARGMGRAFRSHAGQGQGRAERRAVASAWTPGDG